MNPNSAFQQLDPAFYAEVKMVPTESLNNSFNYLSYNDRAVIVDVPNLGPTVVSFCSDGYGLLPNEDIFPALEAELSKVNIAFTTTRWTSSNHAKFFAEYKIVGSNAPLLPVIKVFHSYNQQTMFFGTFGFYNKKIGYSMFGPSKAKEVYFSHVKGNLSKMIENLVTGLQDFLKDLPNSEGEFEELQKVQKNPAEIEQIIEASTTKIVFLKSFKEEILTTFATEVQQGSGSNLFTLYEVLVRFINSPILITSPDERIRYDKKFFKYLRSL